MSTEEKEVPVGLTGELWVKGPNIFIGYLNNPEGTRNAKTEDGYFKTRDVDYQDNEGNFYITDLVKELSSTRDSKYRLLNLRVSSSHTIRLMMWPLLGNTTRTKQPKFHTYTWSLRKA
jgi:acyl-CoA synthetase (AMP-forming)/AMP-acid ligase II